MADEPDWEAILRPKPASATDGAPAAADGTPATPVTPAQPTAGAQPGPAQSPPTQQNPPAQAYPAWPQQPSQAPAQSVPAQPFPPAAAPQPSYRDGSAPQPAGQSAPPKAHAASPQPAAPAAQAQAPAQAPLWQYPPTHPYPAQSTQAQSAQAQQAQAQPAQTQPYQGQPAQAQPYQGQPAQTEPARAQQGSQYSPQQVPAQQTPAQQVPVHPVPVPVQPVPVQPPQATQPPVQLQAPQPQAPSTDPFAFLFATTGPTPTAQPPEQQPVPTAAAVPAPAVPVAAVPVAAAAAAVPTATPSDDPFAALFGSAAAVADGQATEDDGWNRRDARGRSGGGRGGGGYGQPRRKRNLLWLKILLPIVLVLGAAGGVAAYAWFNYNEQVRDLLGIPLPNDYEGTGNGEEVIVTILSGDIGSDVANTLHTAGVTMTFDAVYDYLVEHPDIGFMPGNWRLQKEMSAASAVAALQDDDNKVTSSLLIREGEVLPNVLELIASTTGIPLEEVQAAAADPAAYGVPAAPSLEGYLFPATYELDGAETAQGIIQRLVDETFTRLDGLGVPVERRHEILTMAGLIQREAGSNEDDFFKVSRVFWNRIEQGMLLESDATVAYGTGNLHTVWTTDAERADPDNPYNTYVHPGLPVGPIGAPGELAIQAALQPVDGPWLYFVPINLATGETAFSETYEQHLAARDQLLEWCAASPENDSYCE